MQRNAVLASLALSGLLLAPSAPRAQGVAVSPATVALSPVVPAAAASASSPSRRADYVVGLPNEGTLATSPSYQAWVGVSVGQNANLVTNGPVVLAVDPPVGDADGGEPVRVLGFGMPADVVPTVHFGDDPGLPATNVAIESNTSLTVTTPPGQNVFGNPLGATDVEVVAVIGSSILSEGFVYTPGFVEEGPALVGDALRTRLHLPPGSLYGVSWGKSIGGFALPLPPFEGKLEIINPLIALTPILLSTSGEATFVLPILDDPTLIGASLELQTLAITGLSPLAGGFTNKLVVPLL